MNQRDVVLKKIESVARAHGFTLAKQEDGSFRLERPHRIQPKTRLFPYEQASWDQWPGFKKEESEKTGPAS